MSAEVLFCVEDNHTRKNNTEQGRRVIRNEERRPVCEETPLNYAECKREYSS